MCLSGFFGGGVFVLGLGSFFEMGGISAWSSGGSGTLGLLASAPRVLSHRCGIPAEYLASVQLKVHLIFVPSDLLRFCCCCTEGMYAGDTL